MTIAVPLDTLLKDEKNWELVASMIKAELVPEDRMAMIAREFPEFWATVHPVRS